MGFWNGSSNGSKPSKPKLLEPKIKAFSLCKNSFSTYSRSCFVLQVKMGSLIRNLKIKIGTCKRITKELHSYEREVEREAAKTADMKEKGADPYDLKQQENVLAESRMMIPDCRKRLEASLADIKESLAELESNQQDGEEIEEARSVISEMEALCQTSES